MTEKPAVNLGQRQHTLNLPLRFGIKEPCLVPERAFDDSLPSRPVEKTWLPGTRDITNSSHRSVCCGSSKSYGWGISARTETLTVLPETRQWDDSCCLIEENPIHPVPVEVTGEGLDPLFHAVEIIIVAEARLHTDGFLARLLVIYFPGMKIKNRRALLQLVQPFEKPPVGNRIGPKPEVTSASRGNVLPEQAHGGNRQFQQSIGATRIICKPGGVRYPVMVMPDWINA